jgi:hypothetical protein
MTTYFLFGKEAVNTCLMLEGIPDVKIAEHLSEIPHAVFVWDDGSHPMELLNEYTGWDDYMRISESLYKLLRKGESINYNQ